MNYRECMNILWGMCNKEPGFFAKKYNGLRHQVGLLKVNLLRNKRGAGVDVVSSILGKVVPLPGASTALNLVFTQYADKRNSKNNRKKIMQGGLSQSQELKLEASNLLSVTLYDLMNEMEMFFNISASFHEEAPPKIPNKRPVPRNCTQLKEELRRYLLAQYHLNELRETATHLINFMEKINDDLNDQFSNKWKNGYELGRSTLSNLSTNNKQKNHDCGKLCIGSKNGMNFENQKFYSDNLQHQRAGWPISFTRQQLFSTFKLKALQYGKQPEADGSTATTSSSKN